MPRTVALIYGFGEGPWHGKQFTKRLTSADFTVVTDTAAADIVIAHSAGVFYVPELHRHQVVMLINPSYWPGKHTPIQMAQKIGLDIIYNGLRHPLYLLQKTAHNIFYICRDFPRTREIIRRSKNFELAKAVTHHKTIVVRNHADTWLTPNLQKLQTAFPTLRIHHVPGEHDDCWLHPDRYVDLLQSDI